MQPLTDKQAQVLDFIADCVRSDGRPPTVREIGKRFRFASTNTARSHLAALERKGFIQRDAHAARGIRLTGELSESSGLPVVGRVAAGPAILAVENVEGHLPIEEAFPRPWELFCLRVHGDSMIDAGIWDGDYVIVRRRDELPNGQIGVAVVDGEATVKRLRRQGRYVEMEPANDDYQTVRVDLAKHEFFYAGQVVGVHRILKET